jgi:hypothetical protein
MEQESEIGEIILLFDGRIDDTSHASIIMGIE